MIGPYIDDPSPLPDLELAEELANEAAAVAQHGESQRNNMTRKHKRTLCGLIGVAAERRQQLRDAEYALAEEMQMNSNDGTTDEELKGVRGMPPLHYLRALLRSAGSPLISEDAGKET